MKVTKPFDFYNIPVNGWVETKSGRKVLDLTYLPNAGQQNLVGVLQGASTDTWHFDGVYHHDRGPSVLDLVIAEEVEDKPKLYYWAIRDSNPLQIVASLPSKDRPPFNLDLVPVEVVLVKPDHFDPF